ncbi:hypothetical protein ACVIJ6_002189 [Bradyrhizobium sp. USDA 4369]
MLRIKLVVAAASLIAAALMARSEFAPAMPPCTAVAADCIALDSPPFHADLHVDSADDPARVALRDDPQAVDLVVVDHPPVQADQDCGATAAVQAVGIATAPPAGTSRIDLASEGATDGRTDDRIFIRSDRNTARRAAASVAAAHHHDVAPANSLL